MNAIIGFTDLGLRETLDKNLAEYLRIVKTSASDLLALVNDVLDLSKIEAGRVELEERDFSLRESLREMINTLGVQAAEKGLELLYFIEPDVPDQLRGDPGRMRQVLLNLVGNAIKFTAQGEILVVVRLDGLVGDKVQLKFAVTDSGIGIEPVKQKTIFDPFTQADASHTREYGGTGLGLAIANGLVNLMGGSLSVDSQPGEGSTFMFQATLGLARLSEESGGTPATEPTSQESLGRGRTILLVEDNPINRKLASTILTREGFQVRIAEDGQEAVDACRVNPPDLVLMDVEMPKMDGLTATRAIREAEGEGGFRLPIVAMTAHAMRGDQERCLAAGMDAYISKPIDIEILLTTLAYFLPPTGRAQEK